MSKKTAYKLSIGGINTIDEKAVVKMNKAKISTCLFIWKHVLTVLTTQ